MRLVTAAADVCCTRRLATALLALGAVQQTPSHATAASRSCSTKQLLDSREQLDLAVQASSVQAWADAAEVAESPALDPAALSAALEASCTASKASRKEVLSGVEKLRVQLTKLSSTPGGASNVDVMDAMYQGTAARSAMDAVLSGDR